MIIKIIKNSLHDFKRTYLTIGYDIIQFIIFQLIIFIIFLSFTNAFPSEEFIPSPETIQSHLKQGFTDNIVQSTSQIKMFIIKIYVFIITGIILNLIISSLFRNRVYNKIKQQKFSLNFFKKFLLLNSTWLIFWLIIFYSSIKLIKEKMIVPIIIIELIIYLHTTPIFRYFINNKDKYKKILNNFFKISIFKSYKFIIPFIIITIMSWLNLILTYTILPKLIIKITPESLITIVSLLLAIFVFITFFIIMNFSRLYYINIIKSIK
jgi:hypothetical protein